MQNLIEKIKSPGKTCKNTSFSLFFIKSRKDKVSKYQSQMNIFEIDSKKRFKCLKKIAHGTEVLKNFLSPSKKHKQSNVIVKKLSEEIEKDSRTSKDSGWEGMSTASSLSSLITTGNFCTSSPVSERKFKLFHYHQHDPHIEVLKFNNNDNDNDITKVNGTEMDYSKSQEQDKYTTLQLASGNFIRSKSDSEILSELDCDNIVERIREITRDDPLRQSYPGMSNTTRRESCHQLLKILLTQIDVNQCNEDKNNSDSHLTDDTFNTFDSDFVNFSDSAVALIGNSKKTLQSTMKISSKQLEPREKLQQSNTSGQEHVQSINVNNVSSISKPISVTAGNS